jgi:hypothetical protein
MMPIFDTSICSAHSNSLLKRIIDHANLLIVMKLKHYSKIAASWFVQVDLNKNVKNRINIKSLDYLQKKTT